MLECWNEDFMERPAFFDIFERLLACWNIVKPVSNYAKSYSYDENGNRVRTESAYQKKAAPQEFDEEDGDMYDLGGETDAQIQGKRRIVRSPMDGDSEDSPYSVTAVAVEEPSPRAVPNLDLNAANPNTSTPNDEDDREGSMYDIGGEKPTKVFVTKPTAQSFHDAQALQDDDEEVPVYSRKASIVLEASFGFSGGPADQQPTGQEQADGYLDLDA
eukprot:m.174053 g.174053  ORF g.174053 m.174053 type:complete len:216 (+) comp53291_c0_seq1:1-648(+)